MEHLVDIPFPVSSPSRNLPYDRYIACSRAGSPERAIYCFLFQVLVFSSFHNFIHWLLTSSSLFSHPFCLSISNVFIRRACPIQLAFLSFILCRMFISPVTLYNTSSFFTWSIKIIISRPQFRTFKVFLICFPKHSSFNTMQSYGPSVAFFSFLPLCSRKASSC